MTNDLEADVSAVSRIDAVPAILEVVCRTTGMGFAAVARVTEDRWIACAVRDEIDFGLKPGGELKIETTICNEIRASGQEVVIDHVAEDESYRQHHTPAMYGFQSYISMPIFYPDGNFFGTLCAIDPQPAKLNRPEIVKMFRLFSELIMHHLQALEKTEQAQDNLRLERDMASRRERFVAMLSHDLRNPLAAIDAGAEMLKRETLSNRGANALQLVQRSVQRMVALVDDVLDVARVRLGTGVPLVRKNTLTQADLEQVIDELQSAWPDRTITTAFAISREVPCDRSRISQLFSNLVSNALAHGATHAPVHVEAHCRDGVFEFSVANQGNPIPEDVLASLFEPFSRHSDSIQHNRIGLGLYIASEVAHAHGGTLDVSSSAHETRFWFRMPLPRDGESGQSRNTGDSEHDRLRQ
jgi:signal transduction histidine kinase